MSKNIYSMSLRDIIPPSIASDPQTQAMIDAIDPELQSVSFDMREALIYSRIDTLAEPVVDLLAWQFHVDFYEPMGLDLETKRRLVKTAILIHKRKGTKWAVQELCDIAFGVTTVEPWYEYDGEPYHFRITTAAVLYSQEAWEKFFRALIETKSERDWLDAVRIEHKREMPVYYGMATVIGGSITADIPTLEGMAAVLPLAAGTAGVIRGRMRIDAQKEVD